MRRTFFILTVLSVFKFSLSGPVLGRMLWAERDGPGEPGVLRRPRRFGREHPPVLLLIDDISNACPGAVCGTLVGGEVAPLFALASASAQQDYEDAITDANRQFDAAMQANMIALGQIYRKTEMNTPPDFTVIPPVNRNSAFCLKAPATIPELNGLVQGQDPKNDPNIFFDPANGKTVLKRSQQENSDPFNGTPVHGSISTVQKRVSSPPVGSTPTGNGSIGNFGKCSVPQIEFGAKFDGRSETSFRPVDPKSYAHGSAQNIDNISKFICDTLVNSCGADQTARNTCASALVAADSAPQKTGGQADAFNAVFGIRTNFNAIQPLDDHGKPIGVPSSSPTATGTPSQSQAPNFGKCTTPQIKFAVGLDRRKETAFAPIDPLSYPHGSADNSGVITQFICLELTNTCGANQAAKDLCTKAETAANAAPPLTGEQADAFNNVFGIKTNFAAVTPIDNTGKPVVTNARRAILAAPTGRKRSSMPALRGRNERKYNGQTRSIWARTRRRKWRSRMSGKLASNTP